MLSGVMSLAALAMEVVARPYDDGVREAYAAAVRRSDPERAELIRLQLMTTRMRRTGVDTYPHGMRESDLIRAHHARWAEPIAQYVSGYQFFRGFVELVTVDAEWFLESADELYDLAPILHLDLTDAKLAVEDLFRSEWLERIQSINLMRNDFGDVEARLLADCPHLRNLEWLDLSHNQIGDEGFEALAASENLPRLGYLDFSDNATNDPTPQHADEYDATSVVAEALQQKYGHREWLDAHPRYRWPPDRDAVWVELA
ncbi:MAG: hypothetical protein JWR83_2545 [Aeromicrobium sp.]|nr:hypothetical protein [Aeromicrobium sp.]